MSSLSEEIRDILRRSGCELTAAEVLRRVKGDHTLSEVSLRLRLEVRRGRAAMKKGPRRALTGPREVAYFEAAPE